MLQEWTCNIFVEYLLLAKIHYKFDFPWTVLSKSLYQCVGVRRYMVIAVWVLNCWQMHMICVLVGWFQVCQHRIVFVKFVCFPFQLDKSQLKPGTRVALDMTTLTIMRLVGSIIYQHSSIWWSICFWSWFTTDRLIFICLTAACCVWLIHTAGDGCVPKICFLFSHRYLPREVDPLVYNMSHEDPGSVSYSEIGGLSEQIRELREVDSLSNNLQCFF